MFGNSILCVAYVANICLLAKPYSIRSATQKMYLVKFILLVNCITKTYIKWEIDNKSASAYDYIAIIYP